jgi:hypothetical protein
LHPPKPSAIPQVLFIHPSGVIGTLCIQLTMTMRACKQHMHPLPANPGQAHEGVFTVGKGGRQQQQAAHHTTQAMLC